MKKHTIIGKDSTKLYSKFTEVPLTLDILTNGVRGELITTNNGVSLLGIRVSWTIKSEYLNCQFSRLEVWLNRGQHVIKRAITVNDTSANFFNLDCNQQYTPRVTANVLGFQIQDTGDSIIYRGS